MWTIVISQFVAALSVVLFSITLTHRDMDHYFKAIGFSSLSLAVFLGCGFIFLPEVPSILMLFLALIWHSTTVLLLSQQIRIQKNPAWLMVLGPLAVMLAIKAQPYTITALLSNIFIAIVLLAPMLILFGLAIMQKRERILLFYQGLLSVAAVLAGLHLLPILYTLSLVGLAIAQLVMVLYLLENQKRFLYTVLDESARFKENFDDEVEKEVRKRTFYMEMSKEKMAQINKTDHLTKALTRKAVITDIEILINKGSVKKFSIFVFDIDKFKTINDTLGHTTGDVCLKNVAAMAMSSLREGDFVGRFGGDEFIIVLKDAGYKEAYQIGERFRKTVENNSDPKFTLSLGLACYPWDGDTYKKLFEIADKGLYKAKEGGRNQIGYEGYIRPMSEEVSHD